MRIAPATSGTVGARSGRRAGLGVQWFGLLALGTLAAVWTTTAVPAYACTCAADAIWDSDPPVGASGVPLDIAPIIHGWFTQGTVELVSEDGSEVPLEVSAPISGLGGCVGRSSELRPLQLLAPNTSYVIRASSEVGGSSAVEFRTGDTTLAEVEAVAPELVAPEVVVGVLSSEPVGSVCGGSTTACIHIEGSEQAEVIVLEGGEAVGVAYIDDGELASSGLLNGVPDCFEVRSRRANGDRSEATVLCEGDFALRPGRSSDYAGYELLCEGGLIGDDVNGGEADSAPPSSPDGVAGGAAPPTNDRSLGVPQRRASANDSADGRSTSWGCSTAGAADPSAAALALLWLLGVLRRRR